MISTSPVSPGRLVLLTLSDSFAYVDFATLDAKKAAITMSEMPLEGRRVLIKDGTWHLHSLPIVMHDSLIAPAQATVLKVAL